MELKIYGFDTVSEVALQEIQNYIDYFSNENILVSIKGQRMKKADKKEFPASGMGKSLTGTLEYLLKVNVKRIDRYRTYYVHLLALSVPSLAVIYQVLVTINPINSWWPFFVACMGISFHFMAMYTSLVLRLIDPNSDSRNLLVRLIARPVFILLAFISKITPKYDLYRSSTILHNVRDGVYSFRYDECKFQASDDFSDGKNFIEHIKPLYSSKEKLNPTTHNEIQLARRINETAKDRLWHERGIALVLLIYSLAIVFYALASLLYAVFIC